MSSRRAIVAGHADFATGIISAVAQISGRGEVFVALSNRDLSAQDVERALRDAVERDQAEVVFTDLPAGSCTMAARRLQRERPGLTVVTGTNLATLLDWLFAEHLSPGDAARHAAEKGRAALLVAAVPGGTRGA
jgi:N-acetylgalactosamine PTS system EIIA component